MDSFEINKVLGALLGTCLVLVAMHIASGAIFTPAAPAKPGYEIAVKEEQPAGEQQQAKPPEQPIENMLASASIQQGANIAKQCQACHNLGKGQGAKIGPDLYGVVGRPRASEPGFNYSSAMKAKGGTWTFDELNKFLADPRGYIPGTLMTFAGLPSEKQRADVIDFLNSNSDKPEPLPTAQNAPAPANNAPANPAANAPANKGSTGGAANAPAGGAAPATNAPKQ